MNKPEFYPYVLLPEEIEKIKIEGIPVPELRELPEFPEKPKKRFLGTIILIVSIGIMILLGSTHIIKSSFYSNTITYLAFFISLVSLTATVFEILHNTKSKKQYRIAVKLYNELKEEREQVKEERRKAIEDNNNQKAIDAYRHSAINTYFKYSYNKIQIRQREYTPAQKRFLIFLEQYFEGKILENARIVHELKEIDYSPDFILKLDNPKVNIVIDIEEPYRFEGKKIVVKKNQADNAFELRYKVTNELRWVCIVFNEEQVVTQPTESCKLIAHAIDEILLKEKYSEQFKSVNKIKRAEIPGQRELSAYIRNKYRENYLLAAGLIDDTDFNASEVEIRSNGSDEPEKIVKTSQEKQKKLEGKKMNDLKDKKSIIDTNGKSKSIIVEKKEEETGDIEQLEIAKNAAEKFKVEKKEIESGKTEQESSKKESSKIEKSQKIDLNKEKQNAKKELLKSIEEKLEKKEKAKTTKRVSLKKEAEKLNILYSKTKENKDRDIRQKEKEIIEKEKAEKEKAEKLQAEKVKLEKERLLKNKDKEEKANELSLAEKAKKKRDEHVKERVAKEKAEKERLEKERQEKVNAEKERIVKEKAEKERLEKEQIAKEKAEKEHLEKERLTKEKVDKEKLAKEKAEKERLEKERILKEKAEKEKAEKERLEKERLEKEQIAKEKAEKERLEKERIEKMQKELEEKQKIEARNRLMEKYKVQIEKLVAEKQWDMLFDACNEAIKEFPYWEWPYYRRSTMHGNKGQFVDAIEDCNRALSINPKLTDAVYNRATAKFYLQKYEEALEDYQKCIDLNYKNSAEAYFNRGLCFQNLNHPKKAYREFVKAKNLGNIKAIDILNTQYSS